MFRFASRNARSKVFKTTLLGAAFAALLGMALIPISPAPAAQRGEPGLVDRSTPANLDFSVSKDGIPNLASISFAWLSDGADWLDPPAGTQGHGRIKNDPDHPL